MSKKKILLNLCCLLIVSLLLSSSIYADDIYEGKPSMPTFSSNVNDVGSKVPNINAMAAIVIDTESGRVIYEKNAYSKRAIASTTKIVTAILALENGNLDDEVTVSKRAASVWGSTIKLKEGQKLKLRELLYGLMLNSGNDAAIAIAEHIGGTVENFCEMMTKKAHDLGAKNSSFKSPHGLDMDGHYSTAYDLAVIARYALKNKTFSNIVRTQIASIPGRNLHNTNEMLYAYQGADGVKTGYTGKAGRCLVTSATRNNWRIISVTLGSPTRNARAQSSKSILDYAFENYKLHKLISKAESVAVLPVIKGLQESIPVNASRSIKLPLRQDEMDALVKEVNIGQEKLKAPVKAGTRIGNIRYVLNDKVIAESPLEIGSDVERKGILDYLCGIFTEWLKLME
ncbi:MAG: D-alanyl-D-alanine carboxypeptidase [Clostridia bacterium]|nr:D-alanyl-D-alanine carboxypeptidase [Clostridia bacterium]